MRHLSPLVCKLLILGTAAAAAACGVSSAESADVDEGAFTSNSANVLQLSFKGSVLARTGETPRKAITTQLNYLQGALASDIRGNAQANMPNLSNIEEVEEGDKKRISYDAKIAVAWPKGLATPETYDVALPLDVSALSAFNSKYDGTCGHNEYGQASFWHDWNPKAAGCTTDEADTFRVRATVAPHPQETQGKYPEYDKVWEDGSLDIVAVFGIIASNTPTDEGARTREQLLDAVTSSTRNAVRTEAPETRGILKDSTVSGTITIAGQERRVNVTGILVQEVASAGSAFNARYGEATAAADVVIYEGHSGLGKNINALGTNMGATAGKYQFVYLYGCQTLGYLGSDMHNKRVGLNGAEADPEGTKFLDVMATALPAYGDSGRSTLALYRAMLDPTSPKSFSDLMNSISSRHLTVVFGEHDNTFAP